MKKLLLSVGIAAAILAGCNNSSSGGGLVPVPPPATTAPATTAPATTAPATTAPATTAPATTAPATTAPATTAPATSAPATTAPATSTPAQALSFYWSSTNLASTAPTSCNPLPSGAPANAQCTSPINLYASGQNATLQITGGTAPYTGILNNCSTGAGVQPPATLSQNPGLSSFTVTANNSSGSCNIQITDSSNPQKNITIQEITTLNTVTVS